MTGATRAKLRSMAQKLIPIFNIGKNGVTDSLVKEVCDALDAHELIKLSVLKSAELDAKSALDMLCRATGAEPVTAIGNKIVLYRRSEREDISHIEL